MLVEIEVVPHSIPFDAREHCDRTICSFPRVTRRLCDLGFSAVTKLGSADRPGHELEGCPRGDTQ
jgi:hypothetical protein